MMPTLLSLKSLESDRDYVRQQLAEAAQDPWGTSQLMWKHRLADIEEQIGRLSAEKSQYASVALVFDGSPVIGSGDIRLDFTAQALDSYQKIVSAVLASKILEDLPKRGKLPGIDQSRLYIRDLVRGSMGFILEEIVPEQSTLFPTVLKGAVEDATRFLSSISTSSDEEFESTLATTQPRIVKAVQKFAKVLNDAGASTKIAGDEFSVELSVDEVARLSSRLNEFDVNEETETVEGILEGILPESLTFEFQPGGEAQLLKGAVTEELAAKYKTDAQFRDRLLMRPVQAVIKHTRTVRNGRLINEKLTLEGVESLAIKDERG